jgi:hypothetical protein
MANDMSFAFGDARRGLPDCRPTQTCDARPVCPACGALECFCRPRFFAGQLLTEEDLNRLDHYIVAKNRLHNRHLFGDGVVCGLEVVCTTCDPSASGNVVVKPGYALSPCGNDIVVCRQELVNVCELIERCRPRQDDCMQPDPYASTAVNDDSKQGEEEWVLAICYQEKPSRGVTALRGSSCGCGGSCGGSGCGCKTGSYGSSGGYGVGSTASSTSSCGCSGGAAKPAASMKASAKFGSVPVQCEPTLTCEGYSFVVYRLPPTQARPDMGALVRRFYCCLEPLWQSLVALPRDSTDPLVWERWLQALMTAVRDLAMGEGLYDCELAARVTAVALPSRTLDAAKYQQAWSGSAMALLEILFSVFQKCLCSALLPPCPPPAMNDCVPIATVKVTTGRCRIKRVCNFAQRRFALTFPALEYWLSWLPWVSSWFRTGKPGTPAESTEDLTLKGALERMCCTSLAELFGWDDVDLGYASSVAAPEAEPAPAPPPAPKPAAAPAVASVGGVKDLPTNSSLHPFTALLAETVLARDQKASAATVLLSAIGARRKDGSRLASDLAVEFPAQAMMMHQLVAPAMAPLLPLVSGLLRARLPAEPESKSSVDALASEVAGLRETLKKQQEAINKLSKR